MNKIIRNSVLSATLTVAGLTLTAGPALAENPPYQPGMEIAQPDGGNDPKPQGPGGFDNPEEAPDPQPEGPGEITDPQGGGDPDPQPEGPGDITDPQDGGDPDPQPEGPGDLTNGDGDDPRPEGPGDLTDDEDGCGVTHGCEPTDGNDPDGHCFDDAGNVVDVEVCSDDTPGDEPSDEPGDEPGDGSGTVDETPDSSSGTDSGSGSLPHTGAATGLLAAIGSALLGGGAILRRSSRKAGEVA